MLKTIVLGAATLFLAAGAALAAVDSRDVNQDGVIQAWELNEYYIDNDSAPGLPRY